MVLAILPEEASPPLLIPSGLHPGVAMLAKSFAAELRPRATCINAMLPNLFATDRGNA